MNLSSLKKNSSLDKLKKAADAASSNNKYDDNRYWKPTVDSEGNGYAVIRFLDTPAVDGEDGLPYVQIWSHGFQGPGGWYIEKSLTTLGKADPVSELNTQLWNSGVDANKKIARDRKRKLKYHSNILVVSDPKNPSNEGKVFLFEYGKKIYDKLNEKMFPQFPDEESMNPFSFWEGANFRLKVRKVDGFPNYEKSEFDKPSPLFSTDEEIEKVWKSEYSLKELLNEKNFKSYDELKAKLNKVVGAGGSAAVAAPRIQDEQTQAPSPGATVAAKEPKTAESVSVDDDDMSWFENLAD